MISEETVSHVAKLARLALSPEEVQRYSQELSKILNLVDELSALDLSGSHLDVTADHPPMLLREDIVKQLYDRDTLLTNAPHEENGFLRVPRILEAQD